MAADVVSAYVLPTSLNLLESEDLGEEFQSSLRFFFETATSMRYLGFMEPIITIIPSIIFNAMLTQPAKALIRLVRVSCLLTLFFALVRSQCANYALAEIRSLCRRSYPKGTRYGQIRVMSS